MQCISNLCIYYCNYYTAENKHIAYTIGRLTQGYFKTIVLYLGHRVSGLSFQLFDSGPLHLTHLISFNLKANNSHYNVISNKFSEMLTVRSKRKWFNWSALWIYSPSDQSSKLRIIVTIYLLCGTAAPEEFWPPSNEGFFT